MFDDATIQGVCHFIQPLSNVELTGDIRHVADVRNVELQSSREDRFRRIYGGENRRSREKVILYLYDASASTDRKTDHTLRFSVT